MAKWVLLICGLLTLSACGGNQAFELAASRPGTEEAPLTPPSAQAMAQGAAPAPTARPAGTSMPAASPSSQPSPGPTATPTPANTPSPTLTPVPTKSATPTPTPTPLHPLAIEYMRRQRYPGSEITIEQTLAPGSNYERYIASYLSDGFKIYALLTVPRGQKPETGWPVVIFNHGYIPPEQYRTTERYVAYVDALARSGYIVFRSDYRGHGSSEGDATGGLRSAAYTVDVLNAVQAIKGYPDADPERIGMWGHSLGGGITLRTMVTTSDIKAGVIWAGTVAAYPELIRRWAPPGDGSGEAAPTLDPNSRRGRWLGDLIEAYGSPEENPAFYAAISPNTYLADLSGPVQLHHGTADTSVPVEFSESLQAQIQAVGKPVELFTYQGDNHNISRSFATAMARSIQFFDTHVRGTERR